MPKLHCVTLFSSLYLASFCRCFGQSTSSAATTPRCAAPVYKALLWQRPHSSTPCAPSSSSRTWFDHAQRRDAEVMSLMISHHHQDRCSVLLPCAGHVPTNTVESCSLPQPQQDAQRRAQQCWGQSQHQSSAQTVAPRGLMLLGSQAFGAGALCRSTLWSLSIPVVMLWGASRRPTSCQRLPSSSSLTLSPTGRTPRKKNQPETNQPARTPMQHQLDPATEPQCIAAPIPRHLQVERWHLGLTLKQPMSTDSILHTRIHPR